MLTSKKSYDKIITVKEIEKPLYRLDTKQATFQEPLKSDCTNHSNISIFTFQVFSHKKIPSKSKDYKLYILSP